MEVFDYSQAMERVSGDLSLLEELMEIFFNDVPIRLTQLRQAVSDGDADGIRQESHALKGALGNLGSVEAFNLASSMEQLGRENRLGEAQDALDGIVAALQRFQAEAADLKERSQS